MRSRTRVVIILVAVCFARPVVGVRSAQDPKALPSIDVKEPKDLAQVQALNDTLTALSRRVTDCVTAGDALQKCQCSDPDDLLRLRKGYERLKTQHPEWTDRALSYHYVNKNGRNISGTLMLSTLRRQLETLKCE